MVKIILGSAIGGLVAGGIALLAAGQLRGGLASGQSAMPGAGIPVMTASPTVACAPQQEPVLSRVMYTNGQEGATVTCVDRAPQGYGSYPQAGYAAYAPPPQVVSMVAPAPVQVVRRAAPAQARPARQVVYRNADDDVVRYEPDARQGRSVAKTAMVIGGSAGTGAGVGAIFGGKKGALIGAAIGGGAASIYEASKR
jgi:hypothetical protein